MSLPVSTLLTSEFEEDIRYEVWRESLAPLFFAEAVGDPLQFNGQAKLYLAEDMVFAKTQFDALNFILDRKWSRQYEPDCLLIQLYTQGGYQGISADNSVQITPASISILDLRQTLYTHTVASEVITTVVPRHYVADRKIPPSGYTFTSKNAATPVLANQILALWQNINQLDASHAYLMLKSMTNTILDVANDTVSDLNPGPFGSRFEGMLCYIDTHLNDDTALSESRLCKQFYCSRATLYRWFGNYGGVRRYIKKRRLSRIYKTLLTQQGASLNNVASRFGFKSAAHFSRSFKEEFNLSPSQLTPQKKPGIKTSTSTAIKSNYPQYRDWLLTV